MRVGSLFSGIGGFDLGLERAGHEIVWQVENDAYCRKVLAKHWPDVPCYEDVHDVGAHNLEEVDVICGGFPCQDISSLNAAKAGIGGDKSGLWAEYARILGELRPRIVLVENVADIIHRGLDQVLADLAALGYDAEWETLPARAFGAPISGEGRDRVFVVADSNGGGCFGARIPRRPRGGLVGGASGDGVAQRGIPRATSGHWATEPNVGRVAHGVPNRVDRLRGLGNAIVPQVAEWIGRRLPSEEV